jgi:5'-nucleotidase
LAANVIDKKTGKTFANVPPFIIREFDGVRVGIFGLVLPETKTTSRAGPDVEFVEPCDVAKKMVSEVARTRSKGGRGPDASLNARGQGGGRCSDVDVIIGGHEHTLLESAAGGAPIFKMTSDARELGRIDLNISKSSGKLESIDWKVIPVDSETPEDPDFVPVYRKYAGLLKELASPVGRTTVPLDARSAENRRRETNVGNLVYRCLSQSYSFRCSFDEWRFNPC